jgi:hypothetical protein
VAYLMNFGKFKLNNKTKNFCGINFLILLELSSMGKCIYD